MKQEELAEHVSLSPNYMSAIERGVKIPRLETFIRIANTLTVPSDMLLIDVLNTGNEIKSSMLAEKIRERAKENNIPIIENKPLARTMYTEVEIGDFIPIELYQSVAEIIALVYKMREENKYKI